MRKAIILVALLLLVLPFIEYKQEDLTPQIVTKAYEEFDKEQQKQIDCLATNIYREAGTEPEDGKVAVALVTMNRVKAQGFPETVCKVVQQKTRNVCQFSWKCFAKLPKMNENLYKYSREIAIKVFLNHHLLDDITLGALFYHADYVRPRWKRVEVTTKIGRHIFYKPIGAI
jgi:spore germination cell wall hydrolase CwlJ-like protein